jgi:glycerophosphoryl diester phosphodiesterase
MRAPLRALAAALGLAPALALAAPPEVYAHRGATRLAPENSLAACAAAFALGAGCEVDVRAARDGELVLMHDASVRRTTTGRGAVAKHTLGALRELRLRGAAGEARVPTLAELLALPRGGRPLLLDLKLADAAFHARVLAELSAAPRERGEVALGVRGEEQAHALRGLAPALPQVALIESPRQIERLAAAGAETIRLEVAWLARDPTLAPRVRAVGARLLVGVPGGDRRDLRAALAHAPDALLVDAPVEALALAGASPASAPAR